MLNKILVALDYSDISREVLNAAIALAKTTGGNLMLLHVQSCSEPGYPDHVAFLNAICHLDPAIRDAALLCYAQQWQEFEARGRETLQSFAKEAKVAGIQVDSMQIVDDPGPGICSSAQTGKFDLIVMGRRGHSGWQEMFLGSVSNYVVHHAPCSVLTVQGKVSPESQSLSQKQAVVI